MTGPETPLPTLIKKGDHLSILRHIRAHKLCNSSLVIQHGQLLLNSKSWSNSISSNELLAALEQICIAALEEHNLDLAKQVLKRIRDDVAGSTAKNGETTTSVRYCKLLALCLESEEQYDHAMKIYNDMLKENPSNSYAAKRKYCLLKTQIGQEKEARDLLNSYLEVNGMDVGAWVEMAKSCLNICDYKGAAYCYEEVVLTSPLDANAHCMLGELYLTIGGKENLKLARKHLAQSLELEPTNLRALYGIVSAAETYLQLVEKSQLSSNSGKKKKAHDQQFDEEDVEMAKALYNYGVGKLSNSYKGTFMSSLLDMVLESEE